MGKFIEFNTEGILEIFKKKKKKKMKFLSKILGHPVQIPLFFNSKYAAQVMIIPLWMLNWDI